MLSSGKGGLEQMAVVYTKALVNLGHTVFCLVMDDCPYLQELKNSGASVYTLKNRSMYNLINIFKIIKLLKEKKADIALCHGNRAMSLILNKIVRRLLKPSFKTLGVMHSKHCPYKKRCDNLIFLTNAFCMAQPSYIRQKSFILPNTVLESSHTFKKVHTPLVFGALGRLHPVKGFDVLLNSLAILKNSGRSFKCLIAGSGEEEQKLKQQAHDLNLDSQVEFSGWVNDKSDFFNKIDVFVLSSRSDNMPLAVLEALAYSKPIVSTKCIGPVEVLKNLTNTELAEVENPQSLAEVMQKFIDSPQLIEPLAKEGNLLFNQHYSLAAFTAKLGVILQKVLYNENI